MKRNLVNLMAVAVLTLVASAASAQTPEWREKLGAQISEAKKADARPFLALSGLKGQAPAMDKQKRGRLAAITPRLKGLGEAGLMPMLEDLIAIDRETLTGSAFVAWRVGVLEAVGALRDQRAAPVLRAELEGASDPRIVRAAAEALGSLLDDESAAALIAMSRGDGLKQDAMVLGLGECRRYSAAKELATRLATRPVERKAKALTEALGNLGSAWAWETPAVKASGEGDAVREAAAAALVGAFASYSGEVRRAAEKAILLVDSPKTPELIAQARRAADADAQRELDRLADRFAHSPLH